MKSTQHRLGRRGFLAGAAATTAGITIVRASAVAGTQANSKIALGLIGCGGRAGQLEPHFNKHGGYQWVSCADYYPDRVEAFGGRTGIEPAHRHTTLSGYKKLLEEKIDAVVVESPPYFHPEHSAAAVAAGKHVYVAKPIAVDVPGCQSIGESGRKATEKKLVFLVDFQTRANEFYREAVKRVHRGDIGRLVCGYAFYPWGVGHFPGPKTPEDRLRNWYCIRELSGDFIVEQNIHTLDVATWILNADPIKAVGAGGSKKLRAYGNIWDCFHGMIWFPNDFVLSYMGNQCTPGAKDEIPCRIYGSKGTIDTDYYTHVHIDGMPECVYKGGTFNDLYEAGMAINIKEFHEAVTKGDCSNPTVAPSVRSNLTCVLVRTAAYSGQPVTWKDLLDKNEKWEPDLSGLKS